MFEELDFSPGMVVYNDFDINPNIPFEKQIFSLKEDMFQVNYNDKYLIDIGWSPDFDINGKFKIRIIKDFDWVNPIYFKKTNNLKQLYKLLKKCIEIIKNLPN